MPSASRNGTETPPIDLSIAAVPHGKHADQDAYAEGNTHGWVWMGANRLVCRFGCGEGLFFQALANAFGLRNRMFQFCSNVSLFVIFR